MRHWLTVTLVLLALGGCAKQQPQVRPELTPLAVPPAPPRVIVPPEPEPVPEEPLPEPERVPARPPRRTTPRPDPKAASGTKNEAPPAAAAEPANLPPVTPPAESLEPVLPTSASEVERLVNQQLQKASSDLGRVDYKALSQDGKQQYDMAKRFIEQAGDALRERNLVFAGKLAEKAGGIASVLLGR